MTFADLREAILGKKSVSLKTLQKFAGKTTSFALLVPAAKLYTKSAFQAISAAAKKGSRQINLSSILLKKCPIGASSTIGKVSYPGETRPIHGK